MKLQLWGRSGEIVVEDVAPENFKQVVGVLESSPLLMAPTTTTESPEPAPEAPQGPTAEQFARAGAKLVDDHGYDYEFVAALLEDESIEIEQVLEILSWEERLLIADLLIENGWQPTPDEERELRHAAADIIARDCIRRDGKPLNRYQMIVVGIYACDDHRAGDLIQTLDPVYNTKVAEEEREAMENAEALGKNDDFWNTPKEFPEDVDHEVDYS